MVLPWRTLRPPHSPRPAGRGIHVWSVCAAGPVQQLEGVGVESRAGPGRYRPCAPSVLTQIAPNSSSLFTLFYSIILWTRLSLTVFLPYNFDHTYPYVCLITLIILTLMSA